MLQFSNVSLRRGPRLLIEKASFSVHAGHRVGLTGANGTGKSSLFSMIMGQLEADEGDVSLPPEWVIAHVKQETPNVDVSALEYALQGDEEFVVCSEKMNVAEGEELAHLLAEFESIDGYSAELRATMLLRGLGFTQKQLQHPVTTFSGGWRMRLNLAQALMCRSDLLLLDEPTNHLDLDTVIWLQNWLLDYKGSLLLISHDREFLDTITGHIAHIEHGKIKLYSGNYSSFERVRQEHLSQQQSAYVKQQDDIAKMQSFVDRFRAKATKAKQAQSRLKALERMEEIAPAHVDSQFHFSFAKLESLPDRLFQTKNASIGYDGTAIIEDVEMQLMPGDRVGLIGPNGAGKSTLIKFIAEELPAIKADHWQSQNVKIGYFAQHQLDYLDPEESPLAHLRRLDKKSREQTLRDFLGGFGFRGERVDEAVAPFSGGEKARLALALLVYQKPNLLLLDEPTNHLDLEMRHALTVALQEFQGALVVVSHDRHLLRTVTDELLLVADGNVISYDGDLEDYARWLQDNNKANDKADQPVGGFVEAPAVSKKDQRRIDAERRKALQPLRNEIKSLEKKMEKLAARQEQLQEKLASSDIYEHANKDELKALLKEKSDVDAELETVEMSWMEASEAYEDADA